MVKSQNHALSSEHSAEILRMLRISCHAYRHPYLRRSGNGESRVAVAELTDRFGSYGTIGVSFAETSRDFWTLSYLALSCRVLGRGIERAFLSRLLEGAARQGCRFARAHFRGTGRNRQMLVLYHITGFRSDESGRDGETMVLTMDLDGIPAPPSWIAIS